MKSPGLLEHPVSNNISYIIIQLKQTVLLCNSHWLVKELAYISLCNVGHAVKNLGHSWRTEKGQIIQGKEFSSTLSSKCNHKELAYISLCNGGHAVKNLGHSWRTETGQIIQGKEFSSTLSSKCNHKQVNTCASVMKPQNTKEESLSKYGIR